MKNHVLYKLILISIFCMILSSSIFQGSIVNSSINNSNLECISQDFSEIDFDKKISLLMKIGSMPSISILIVKNDSIVWSNSYGYSDIKNKKDATCDTLYLAGSISKVVTATAIMQLYEKKLFDLDDDVNSFLPFSLRHPSYLDINITFRMLLAHQTSLDDTGPLLFYYFSLLNYPIEWIEEYLCPGGEIYNPSVWHDFPPGSEAYYSSVNYEVLGYLVKIISGKSYVDYCEENIFKPLQMNNTSFLLENLDKNKIAVPYIHLFNKFIALPKYEDKNYASGGMQTSVNDLSHFFIAHMNGGTYNGINILKNETIDLMHTIQYPDTVKHNIRRYGLGWAVGPKLLDGTHREGHEGAVPGGNSYMLYRSTDKVGVIYIINQYSMHVKPSEMVSWIILRNLLFEKGSEF